MRFLIIFNILGLIMANINISSMTITSLDFEKYIPEKFTCDGKNISPRLMWSGAPSDTKSFALIVDDPDAPKKTPFIHWVIFNIPATEKKLDQAISKEKTLKNGIIQGQNDFNKIGYDGPCPPAGKAHRYFFKLYALDSILKLEPGITKDDLLKSIEGHILAEAQLIGLYKRKA